MSNMNHGFLSCLAMSGLLALAGLQSAKADIINEDYTILPAGGQTGDRFGTAVATSGGRVVVGAPYDDENGPDAGAVYIYDSGTAGELYKLMAGDGGSVAHFGHSVAIHNGIVAIGAPLDSELGNNAGAVYLFDLETGQQLLKLLPQDGAVGDEFGNSVSIHNGIVLAGAWRADEHGLDSGAAYLFDATTGNQLEKLLPASGGNFQTFGVSVALDANTVAVGSRTYFTITDGFTFAKVHLFEVSSGDPTGLLQASVENYNGDQGGMFAECLAMDNGLLAVGAPSRSVFFDHSGAVHVFDLGTGQQLQFIYPADGHDRDHFGISLAFNQGILAIGAHEDDDVASSGGSAYLFSTADGTQLDKLLIAGAANSDRFGSSICMENGLVAGGAIGFGASGTATGYVGIFGSEASPVPAPVSDLAIALSGSVVQLNWTATSNATSYRIERRNTTQSPWTSLGSTMENSWTEAVTSPLAMYRVIALND
jgi:hypothetical protein